MIIQIELYETIQIKYGLTVQLKRLDILDIVSLR